MQKKKIEKNLQHILKLNDTRYLHFYRIMTFLSLCLCDIFKINQIEKNTSLKMFA